MFKVNRKLLAAELALLATTAEKKTTMPILSTIKFEFADGLLTLTGTDIDMAIITQVEATGEPWAGCVPSKQLAALVKVLDGDEIIIATSSKNAGRCEIRAGRSKTTLALLPVDQFPEPDKEAAGTTFTVDGNLLREGLRRVLPCVTTEESRYSMAGVQFEGNGSALQLVATDGARLGVATVPDVNVNVKVLVPAEGLRPLLSLESDTLTVETGGNLITFTGDKRVISCRLVAGAFPNWEMIMPRDLPYRMEVDSNSLSTALKRATITRQETFKTGVGVTRGGVRFTLTADALSVIVDENDRGAFDEAIAVTSNLNGESTETRLNPDYLSDFLATHEGTFVCEWQDGETQFLLTWPNVPFQYVIAPMRI